MNLFYDVGKELMLTDVTKKLFTTDEFHRMSEAGIFIEENDRVELIDGEIIQKVKLPRYASARISEVWIEDLTNDVLLIFREPAGDNFKTELTLCRDDSVSPLAFPEAIFKVEDLLG